MFTLCQLIANLVICLSLQALCSQIRINCLTLLVFLEVAFEIKRLKTRGKAEDKNTGKSP